MRDSMRDFLVRCSALGWSEATLHTYACRLTYFRRFARGHGVRVPRNISVELARGFHDELIVRNLKASSRIAYIATVRSYLQWLHQTGQILMDVAARVELPKSSKPLPPMPLSMDGSSSSLPLHPIPTQEETWRPAYPL